MLAGTAGAAFLVTLHELGVRLGIFKFVRYDELPGKAVIVGEEVVFHETAATLKKVHYAPEIYGRVSTHGGAADEQALTSIGEMKPLLYTAGIDEVIFCVNGLSYQEILRQMEVCGAEYDYKIHLPGSQSFVGSNSSHTSGDLYVADRRFNLSQFAQLRNKRIVDIVVSVLLLLLSPVLLFVVKHGGGFVSNCFQVLAGRRTWVGYGTGYHHQKYLPVIKKGVLPPYHILESFEPNTETHQQINIHYEQQYNASVDLNLIASNIKFLGRKAEKDFVEKES